MSKVSYLNRVDISIVDNIANVRFIRGEKHNALDMKMFYAISSAIRYLKKDKTIRAVVVSGEGEDFCSGLDVKSVMNSKIAPLKLLFKWLPWQSNLAQYVSTGWREIPVPVIAIMHGRNWGGGLQIALGADFRIATPDASISIMEARWGLIPDMGGTIPLRELCRLDQVKELAMTGKIISGEQALDYGLVTYVKEDAKDFALEFAKSFVDLSPDAIGAAKRLYHKSWWGSAGLALLRESVYQIKVLLGKNAKIKAYNQTHDKAKPFINRMRW